MNIIVVVSDTFRRDHMPCYGNKEIIAPNFNSFSQKALIFEDCYPASFPTVPTRADFLTGRYTFTYLPWGPLPQNEITLPECLSGAGYNTAAVADTPFLMRNGYGHDRGFEDFVYIRGQIQGTQREHKHMQREFSETGGYCAARTFKEAADWLYRHHKEKFFLYVDTWDPHEPWDPPLFYTKRYYPEHDGEVVDPNYWYYKEDGITEEDLEKAKASYKGEISMVDHWFGYFMERIRTLDLLRNTAILFFSDHGFYFGEHGLFGKRCFRWADGSTIEEGFAKGLKSADGTIYRSPLHNELTQVPCMMYIPKAGHDRVSGLLTLPDLMPTILELNQIKIPDSVQAKSVMPLIQDKEPINDFVVTSAPFEERGRRTKTVDDYEREVVEISPSSITNGTWDLLYAVHGQPVELYRTKEDQGHHNNVFEQNQDVAKSLHSKFYSWLKKAGTDEKYLDTRSSI